MGVAARGMDIRDWLPKPQAALVVTGSDYPYRERADRVCTGTNDEQTIQAAIQLLGTNTDWWSKGLGIVKLLGTFYLDAADVIVIQNHHVCLDASEAVFISRVAGAGNLIRVEKVNPGDNNLTNVRVYIGNFTPTVANAFTGNVIYIKGCKASRFVVDIGIFDAATAFKADTAAVGGYNNEQNLYDIRAHSHFGFEFAGDGSNYYTHFHRFVYEPSDIAGNIGIRNTAGTDHAPLAIDYVAMWLRNNAIGIDLQDISSCIIQSLNYEVLDASATVVKGHPTNNRLIIGNKQGINAVGGTVIDRNGTARLLDLSVPGEALANLMMDRFWQQWRTAGWNSTPINGGTGTVGVNFLDSRTAVAANSGHFHDCAAACLSPGIGSFYATNWDKKLHISFALMRIQTDTECYGRFQLKEVAAEGQLAAKGIGIEVQNFALYGESYGIARGLVNLGVSLVDNNPLGIEIIHYPGWKIEFWVAGVLKGTQATLDNIPSGMGANPPKWVHSIINGATGGVIARLYSFALKTWQAP